MSAAHHQRGWIMLEFMLVTLVAAPLILLGTQALSAYLGRSAGVSAVSHMGEVATALANFTAHNEDILNNVADIQKVRDNVTANREPAWRRVLPRITLAGDAIQQWDGYAMTGNVNDVTTPAAPVLVDCPNKDCVTITIKNLQEWGYLPAGFSDTNPLGFTYKLRIKRIPMAAQPGVPAFSALDAVVVANTPGRLTDNNPYGDPDIIIGMQNAPGVRGLGMSRVTEQADATYFASKGLTGPAVGAVGVYGFDADQSGNLGWFFDPVQWGFDNMVAVLPVIKTALWSGNKDGVYMRIDHPFVRDDLNMMGNKIANLKQVTLDAPCDPDPIKAKAMSGNLATIQATNTDTATGEKLGSGFLLVCGYDQAKQGYIWKKATAGITGVDEAMAGMMDGYETGTDWVCWEHPTAPNKYSNVSKMKFVMYQGKVLAFRQMDVVTWTNVTLSPGGYDLNVDYSSANPSYATGGYGYNWIILYEPATNAYYCDQGAYGGGGNPDIFVIGDWYFGPDGIKFQANGQMTIWGGTDVNGTMGGIPVTGNASVSGSACTTVIDATGGSTTSCVPSGGSVALTGQTTSLAGNRTVSKAPVKQTGLWAFQRRTKMNLASVVLRN